MCAMGLFRPVAHRNSRHSAQKGASRAAVWRNTELFGGTPGRFLRSLRSVEMTKGLARPKWQGRRFPVEPGMTDGIVGRKGLKHK